VETNSTKQYEPRAMLALIALTDLPMPTRISFHPDGEILGLSFERLAAGIAWSSFLGGRTDTYENPDGRRYLDEGLITWHGWDVQLHAYEPIDADPVDTPLPEDVTERLTALTQA
jgi:hypothetical protein